MKARELDVEHGARLSADTECQPVAVPSGTATPASSTGPHAPFAVRFVVLDDGAAHPIVGKGKITITIEARYGSLPYYTIRDHQGYLVHDFSMQVGLGAVMDEALDVATTFEAWKRYA